MIIKDISLLAPRTSILSYITSSLFNAAHVYSNCKKDWYVFILHQRIDHGKVPFSNQTKII